MAGRFLGFHAPGRFDRIVDVESCALISDDANRLLQVLRRTTLAEHLPSPWDVKEHTGFWRHVQLREGFATREHLICLYTAPPQNDAETTAVEHCAQTLMQTTLSQGHRVVGVVWFENPSLGDAAQGSERKVWGRSWFREQLERTEFHIAARAFFQTSTRGAEILYDTIREAIQQKSGTLYDLYCGLGSIGLFLRDEFDALIGIEEIPEAVEAARANAQRLGFANTTYIAQKMEDALEQLPQTAQRHTFVVDPPRAGLHPKVAKALVQAPGDELIYVACHPHSLGRDALILAEGGWQCSDLWLVDLFPQTYHIEAVGRFTRQHETEL
ncbi:MAG: methyltransferase domain-containing protein [Myxococcota bacterium]